MTAVSASLLSIASTAGARPLQPVSPWDLDYGQTQCLASRNYGDAAKPTTLAIRQSPNGETYEILLVRQNPPPEYAEEQEGNVDFGHGPIKAWLLHYRPTTGKLNIYQFRIPAIEMTQARSANAVTLNIPGVPEVTFELAAMPQLLDGLDACTADLKRYWNMGGEKKGLIAKPARGDIRDVFNSGDYPSEAQHRGQEGDAQYLLLVDEKGKVAGCQVLLASGVPVLDAMGCAVIQERASFTPALDSSGRPVRSAIVTPKVRWRLSG
ncbi:MAG TPA: energy transducer TonB [Sphingomicrobium sp.]|nr:energy transducer TonB [Sphingomicrobium sp.]